MNSFSITTELMPYQSVAADKISPLRVGALLMDMGTGKSLTFLEIVRRKSARWDRVFWFSPCVLRENGRHQILQHTNICSDDVEIWDERALSRGINRDAKFHLIGTESLSANARVITNYASMVSEESVVAIDESDFIKNWKSARTQRAIHLSQRARYRYILTGTPATCGAQDLFPQFYFLSPLVLGFRSFRTFARAHLVLEERIAADGRKYESDRVLSSHDTEILAQKIEPYAFRVSKSECLPDLPKKFCDELWFDLTSEQKAAYDKAKEYILSLPYEDWDSVKLLHLFGLLQSIICGYWRDWETKQIRALASNRLAVLEAAAERLDQHRKLIIWSKYVRSASEIAARYRDRDGCSAVGEFHGGVSASRRASDLASWRTDGGPRILVATQSMGGRGLTLNEASQAIFYADTFKYRDRIQSEDRFSRIGQTERPTYVTLRAECGIERRIATAMRENQDFLRCFLADMEKHRVSKRNRHMRKLVEDL